MSSIKVGAGCLTVILVVAVVGIVLSIVGFLGAWGNKAQEVASPDNVSAQHEVIIKNYESMVATSENACAYQGVQETTDPDKDAAEMDPRIVSFGATFNKAQAQYNESVDNLFKGKYTGPGNYPDRIDPSHIDTTDWCEVPAQLEQMRR